MTNLQSYIQRETYFSQHETLPVVQNPQVQSKHTFLLSGPSVQIVLSGQASHASVTHTPWGFLNSSEGQSLWRLRVSLSRMRFLMRCVDKVFKGSWPMPLPRRRLLCFSCSCLSTCYYEANDWICRENVVRSWRAVYLVHIQINAGNPDDYCKRY